MKICKCRFEPDYQLISVFHTFQKKNVYFSDWKKNPSLNADPIFEAWKIKIVCIK